MAKINLKGKIKTIVKRDPLRNYILHRTCDTLNARINDYKSEIKTFVRQLVYEIIVLSKDSANIRTFGLASFELGLRVGKANDFIDAVATRVSKSVSFYFSKLKPVGSRISGRIRISVIKSDYQDVLSLPEAINVTEKGDELPILHWILIMGDSVIKLKKYYEKDKKGRMKLVKGYKVVFETGKGRSGGAIMESTDNKAEFFKIDTSYSGTDDDNWLTRAMEERMDYFLSQIGVFLQNKVFA